MMKRVLVVLATVLFVVMALSSGSFAQEKKLKVAFALLSTIHDLGWTTAHYRGIEYPKRTAALDWIAMERMKIRALPSIVSQYLRF